MRDPSMEQTGIPLQTTRAISDDISISPGERTILRELAKQVAELAARPCEEEKKKLWIMHNDLHLVRPLVFCDPEMGWNEIIGQNQILCKKPLLRVWEMILMKEIYWATQLQDDRVIEPFLNVPYDYVDMGWGLKEKVHQQNDRGSYVWDPPLTNYDEDFNKLRFQRIEVDIEKTQRIVGLANDVLGDILTVRLRGVWWWTLGMTWSYILLRGLENLMVDMMVNPDGVHKLMTFLRDGTMQFIDFLENKGLLALNTGGAYVGSGGFGWTSQLPQTGFNPDKIHTRDMWGFGESQETVGVSPEMFEEFIFPYQLPILERFGLNCYGCCEPLDLRWHVVKKVPRLRRVSVSPWSDRALMAEYLQNKYVLSMKPSPTPLAMSEIDETVIRAGLRKDIKATRGCHVEIIMKDNHTLGNNPNNAVRWCSIAKEEVER